jgi:hypothetical protein
MADGDGPEAACTVREEGLLMICHFAPTNIAKFWDDDGNPLAFGHVWSYAAGTSTPQATYRSANSGLPNPNPVQLNSRGEAPIWLNPTLAYKLNVTDRRGRQIEGWPVDDIRGGLYPSSSLLPELTNVHTLGNSTSSWKNVYLGPAGANAFDPPSGNIGYYARTPAEIAASVAPVNYAYPPLDVRRYGADPIGANDSTDAWNSLLLVMSNASGAAAVIPPGTYKVSSTLNPVLTASSVANVTQHGLTLIAYGAVIDFTAESGYALDLSSPNSTSGYYGPLVRISGLNIKLSPANTGGGIRLNDISNAVLEDCKVNGTAAGCQAAYVLRNTASWCENNRFINCAAVNVRDGMQFLRQGSSYGSFARTFVESFFGANISRYWFNIGGDGISVYESRFTHICGNFASTAYFSIGASGSDADMTSTVIDGIDAEWNGAPRSGPQAVIIMQNYPNTGNTARRPLLYNVGIYAGYTGRRVIPYWADARGASIGGPEPIQGQSLALSGGSLAITTSQNAATIKNQAVVGAQIYDQWQIGGVTYGYEGIAGGAENLITGSAAGDYCLRSTTGALRLSGNNGSSTQLELSAAGVGLYGATPVAQATRDGTSSAFRANGGTPIDSESTFDGYTLAQIVKALRNVGLLA